MIRKKLQKTGGWAVILLGFQKTHHWTYHDMIFCWKFELRVEPFSYPSWNPWMTRLFFIGVAKVHLLEG